jgi:hypothetical protein
LNRGFSAVSTGNPEKNNSFKKRIPMMKDGGEGERGLESFQNPSDFESRILMTGWFPLNKIDFMLFYSI